MYNDISQSPYRFPVDGGYNHIDTTHRSVDNSDNDSDDVVEVEELS